ncbi:hypothetical protein Tco_1140873 [Tanacetum coccineum]
MYRLTYEPPSPSTQPNQVYSPLNRLNLDMDLENLFSTQEYYAGQCSGNDYYEGQGSGNDYYAGQGSGHDYYAGQGSGGNQDYSMGHGSVPVEDGSPIEEVKVPAKENSITGNAMKSKGFWLKVIKYFEKEMGSHRGYNSVLSKWKNSVRPRIAENDHDFSLELCWQILKERPAWKQVEMPAFYAKQNLMRPMGRDQARKKKSSTPSCSEASSTAEGGIVDMVADKWKSFKVVGLGKEKEQQ